MSYELLKLKDGSSRIMSETKADYADLIEEYMGLEFSRSLESYITNLEKLLDENDKEYSALYNQFEREVEHYQRVICDIKEEIEGLHDCLTDKRLNRAKLDKGMKTIWLMANNEL